MKSSNDMPPNLLEVIDGLSFPAKRRNIILHAQDNGASEEALECLRAIPDKNYNSLQDVNSALGLIAKQPGNENPWSSQGS